MRPLESSSWIKSYTKKKKNTYLNYDDLLDHTHTLSSTPMLKIKKLSS